MPNPPFPGWFERLLFQSLKLVAGGTTIRYTWGEEAYRLWQRGTLPRPCRWGNDPQAPLECQCQGCFQRRCVAYFEHARGVFDQLPEHAKAR